MSEMVEDSEGIIRTTHISTRSSMSLPVLEKGKGLERENDERLRGCSSSSGMEDGKKYGVIVRDINEFTSLLEELGTKNRNVTKNRQRHAKWQQKPSNVQRKINGDEKTVEKSDSRQASASRLVCCVRNEVASWATGPLHRGPAESSGG